MVLEDLRLIHEDNERLEYAISERFRDAPKTQRERIARDHQIAQFLDRIRTQSKRGLEIYADNSGEKLKELQAISTGDDFAEFNKRLDGIKIHHKRYAGKMAEDLEKSYKRRAYGEDAPFPADVDRKFRGEETYGRHFDLQELHGDFVNLPGVKRRPNYMQYLDTFDDFGSFSRADKVKEPYFQYISALALYLEDFMKRIKPLENLDKLFATFDKDFEEAWEQDKVAGWEKQASNGVKEDGPATQGTGEGIWCQDCEREFKSQPVYNSHLTGKKHIRAAETRKNLANLDTNGAGQSGLARLKERAVAEREFRVQKLAAAMKTERSDTKVNVERKQTMTDKERAQELEAHNAEEMNGTAVVGGGEEEEEDEDAKKSNPLNLPLAWDGKPIPFWLYKLHGLGNEFKCEICGDYTYMGRRAFEKHFSEAMHLFGLKRLGITNSALFREITQIDEAMALWAKIQEDKKAETSAYTDVVQMEDNEGNVMPEKVYNDLLKAGLL